MEQKTRICLTSARNQSPNKVFNFKKVLQVALLIGVVIWLCYQVKNSYEYGDNTTQNNISKEHETETSTLVGRKGIIGRKEDGGVGDEEFDTNIVERRANEIIEFGKQYIEGTSDEAINSQGDMGHGIHSFHDHTGVPLRPLLP